MERLVLDLRNEDTKEGVHAYLKRELGFPDWYGRNLDALYDELSCWGQDACMVLLLYGGEAREVREYQRRVERVFADAQAENPHLCVLPVHDGE